MVTEPNEPATEANQPGTLGEQLTAVALSIWLGEQRGTTARAEWQEARRRARQHEPRDTWRARR